MATIGKIAIEMVANTARFVSDVKKGQNAIGRFSKQVQKDMKAARASLNAVGKSVLKFGAIFGGVAVLMIKKSLMMADVTAKFADKLGDSVTSLTELQAAAGAADVKTSTLNMGLQRMTRRVSEAALGTGEAVAALDELGISAKDLKQLSPSDQFKEITKAMEKVPAQADKVRLAFKLFDSEGVDMVNLMAQGVDGMAKWAEEGRKTGQVLSAIDDSNIRSANEAIDRGAGAFTGLGNILTSAVAPAIAVVVNALVDASVANNGFREGIQTTAIIIIGAVGAMATVFTGFFGAIKIGWLAVQTGGIFALQKVLEVYEFTLGKMAKVVGVFSDKYKSDLQVAQISVGISARRMASENRGALEDIGNAAMDTAGSLKTIETTTADMQFAVSNASAVMVDSVKSITAAEVSYEDAIQASNDAMSIRSNTDWANDQMAAIRDVGNAYQENFVDVEPPDFGRSLMEGLRESNKEIEIAADKASSAWGIAASIGEMAWGDYKGTAIDAIADIADAGAMALKFTINGIDWLLDLPGRLLNAAKSIGDAVADFPAIIQKLADGMPKLIKALVKAIPKVIDAFVKHAPKIIKTIVDAVPGIVGALAEALPDIIPVLISAAIDFVSAIIRALPKIIKGLVDSIPLVITAFIDGIPDFIGAIITAVPEIIMALVSGVPQIVMALIDGAMKLPGMLWDAIKKIFDFKSMFNFKWEWPSWKGKGTVEDFLGIDIPFIKFAKGGMVGGVNTGKDTVPAMLQPGEFVVQEKAVTAATLPGLKALNLGDQLAGINQPGPSLGPGGPPEGFDSSGNIGEGWIRPSSFFRLAADKYGFNKGGMVGGGSTQSSSTAAPQRSGGGDINITINGNFLGDKSAFDDFVEIMRVEFAKKDRQEFSFSG